MILEALEQASQPAYGEQVVIKDALTVEPGHLRSMGR